MSMHMRNQTTITRPIAPPVNLNDGRLDVVRAGLAGGFVVASILIDALGAWLYSLDAGGLLRFVGGALCFVGLAFGASVLAVSIGEWYDYRQRVRDWHAATLESWAAGDGAERLESVSEWAFSTENPAHVLVAALWVHWRMTEGESTPYAVRRLAGPVFLAGRRVGDLSKDSAESMARRLAALGLIMGRSERHAGDWIPESADDVLRMVLTKW